MRKLFDEKGNLIPISELLDEVARGITALCYGNIKIVIDKMKALVAIRQTLGYDKVTKGTVSAR